MIRRLEDEFISLGACDIEWMKSKVIIQFRDKLKVTTIRISRWGILCEDEERKKPLILNKKYINACVRTVNYFTEKSGDISGSI